MKATDPMQPKNKNVISLPTKPDDTQPWKCTVCGATMEYAQPIGLGKMCELLGAFIDEHEHPETAHTAPAPSPHGVRTLLLGLLAALLFGSLLQGCAAPARLPMGPVVHHAEHDSRTRTAEPGPSHIR